jgi:hypothetical protein
MYPNEYDEILRFDYLRNANSTEEILEAFYSRDNSYEENQKKMELTTSLEYYMFLYNLNSQ